MLLRKDFMDINLSINVIVYNYQLATGLSAGNISSVLPTNLSAVDGGQMHPLGGGCCCF